MIFFTAAQFLVKGAFFQAAILVVTLPFALWHFRSYCQPRFQSSVQDVPLEIAKAMPRTSIPRELFIPSELRPESAGWHPENGKAWQGYGVSSKSTAHPPLVFTTTSASLRLLGRRNTLVKGKGHRQRVSWPILCSQSTLRRRGTTTSGSLDRTTPGSVPWRFGKK